jgi:hypothetical protein
LIRAWRLRQAAEHHLANLRKVLRREPLVLAQLGSATLDADDVHVVRRWLRQRQQWNETETVHRYERRFAAWNGSGRAFVRRIRSDHFYRPRRFPGSGEIDRAVSATESPFRHAAQCA